MKAVTLHELGGPEKLHYGEVEKPVPDTGEVLIQLKYAALNRRDFFITHGQYPGIELPAIPGSDGAGKVVQVGSGVDEDDLEWSVGSEVVINPGLNWGNNPRVAGQDFHILGVPRNGTYAEYVCVPVENVFSKPRYLSWEEAAALPLGALTAYRALFTRGGLQAGETVLLPGIGGGVATFLLQMAHAVGAHVYVTSSSDEKLARAGELGAAGGVNVRSAKWATELKGMLNGGADLSVDSIGGDMFQELVKVAKRGSRIVTFGATAGVVKEMLMPLIFLKQLDIRGSTMGTNEEFGEMISFCEKHAIRPVIDKVYELEQVQQAHERMSQGEQFGKLVLRIPQ